MPLSASVARQLLHTRTITCQGFYREDGLWEIEGHLTDRKSYSFENENRGKVDAGVPVHDMWIRITLDSDLLIHNVEASTDASPYSICPNITKNFSRLKGVIIGPGWRRKVQERLGGVHGCTHLVELLGPVATTAYQTIFSKKAEDYKKSALSHKEDILEDKKNRPAPRLLNSCYAFSENSSVVKERWPNFYKEE